MGRLGKMIDLVAVTYFIKHFLYTLIP